MRHPHRVTAVAEPKRRVVLTGAAGRIGRAVAPQLADRWDLQLTDLLSDDEIAALDITDLEACRSAFAGADAVVHLAAVPDPEATWEQLLPANVIGTYNVAQAAGDAGVRRLVLASSLHAVGAIPADVQRRADDPPRPLNLYGATKAWSEAIGSWIAATASISVVALRIGWFLEQHPEPDAPPLAKSAWFSTRDAAELIRASVEAEDVDFVVAHGISANRYRFAELEQTMDRIGYRPTDDAFRDD
jgi:nucleoside-diphosphate-sugar epimerase